MKELTHKERLSTVTALAAIGFGVAGTWIAPLGIIDSSMLYLIAQLLVFSATMLGFGSTVAKVSDMLNNFKKDSNGKK